MRRFEGWLKGLFWQRVKRVQVWRLARRDGGLYCSYCGVEFWASGKRQRTLDHRVPKSLGGAKWRLGNLVFSCRSCNGHKGVLSETAFRKSEWLADRRRVLEVEARRVAAV